MSGGAWRRKLCTAAGPPVLRVENDDFKRFVGDMVFRLASAGPAALLSAMGSGS